MRALYEAIRIVDDCAIAALHSRDLLAVAKLGRVHTYLVTRATLSPEVF